MKNQKTMASINLHAVLPLLEEIVLHDKEAAEITKGWNTSIQFAVQDGPAATLKFKDGKLQTSPDKQGFPSVGFWFSTPDKLNDMFDGKGIPIIWTGLWHIGIIKGFMNLTKRLEHYMKNPDEKKLLSDPANFDLFIKLNIYAMARGIRAVGENDPEVIPHIKKARDGTIQLQVLPDGPAAYIVKKGDKMTVGTGMAAKPSVYMKFKNKDIAFRLIKGDIDSFAAIGTSDLVVEGYIPLVDTLDIVLDHLGRYLQ